jgi:hypothetical protein
MRQGPSNTGRRIRVCIHLVLDQQVAAPNTPYKKLRGRLRFYVPSSHQADNPTPLRFLPTIGKLQ